MSSPIQSIGIASLGFDDGQYGVLYNTKDPASAGNAYDARFVTYAPGAGVGSAVTIVPYGRRRVAHARIHGTADGWTIVATTVAVPASGFVAAPQVGPGTEVWVYRLAPDGRLREAIPIDPTAFGARVADLAWVGGRLAITWLRMPTTGEDDLHMLSFLGC